jgi:hypothetical protein
MFATNTSKCPPHPHWISAALCLIGLFPEEVTLNSDVAHAITVYQSSFKSLLRCHRGRRTRNRSTGLTPATADVTGEMTNPLWQTVDRSADEKNHQVSALDFAEREHLGITK